MLSPFIIGVENYDNNKRCWTRCKLARLELTEDEKEMYTKQLSDVLKHIDAMNEVDTSNVEPMAHAIDFVNVMREDEVFYEQTKDELMKNAPYEEDGFFRVPKIS